MAGYFEEAGRGRGGERQKRLDPAATSGEDGRHYSSTFRAKLVARLARPDGRIRLLADQCSNYRGRR